MDHRWWVVVSGVVCAAILGAGEEEVSENRHRHTEVARVSEAFGHLLGKNLESLGMKFDVAKIIQGLKDASEGKESPMSEEECMAMITSAQEEAFQSQATDNLKRAEEFLARHEKDPGVHVLEQGKLQYEIVQEGDGSGVEASSTPLINYRGKLLDGTVFGVSKEPELITLEETMPGFSKGLMGMKRGEKRVIFIHPDLAYGKQGVLPPNSLLTFEVEVVEVDTVYQNPEEPLSPAAVKDNPEVALSPFVTRDAIR